MSASPDTLAVASTPRSQARSRDHLGGSLSRACERHAHPGPKASHGQLRYWLTTALVLATAPIAHADGAIAMRGVYYKERSTRVMQPMLDAMFDAGTRGLVDAHLLVDAITSASASSGAAPAQPFTERRYEGGAGYTREIDGPDGSYLDLVRIGAAAKVSREPDYRSLYFGARVEAEIAHKNATVGLGGGLASDEIDASGIQSSGLTGGIKLMCPGDMTPVSDACPLTTYSMFATASHITSRNSLVSVSYDLSKQHGFLSNPYRQVIIAPNPVQERHPNDRTRHALAVSGRFYLPQSQTAFVAAYRYYFDSWKIHAHTPELRILQQVGVAVDAGFRYRYYRQDSAFFWRRRYTDPMAEFLTDDPKMSPFDGHLMEAKLGILGEVFGLEGRWAGARFEGILEYIVQHNRFGNAVVAHASLTVPFEY